MSSFMIPNEIKLTVDTDTSKAARLEEGVEILLLDEVVVTNKEDLDFSMVDASGRKHCMSMTQNLLRKLASALSPRSEA